MPKLSNVLNWPKGLSFWIVVIFLCDQVTKFLAKQFLVYNEAVSVLPGLNWRLLYNQGAAFSIWPMALLGSVGF